MTNEMVEITWTNLGFFLHHLDPEIRSIVKRLELFRLSLSLYIYIYMCVCVCVCVCLCVCVCVLLSERTCAHASYDLIIWQS